MEQPDAGESRWKHVTRALCSCRVLLAIVGFLGTVNLYALRINMSMAIVCMVNQTAVASLDNKSQVSNSTCGAIDSGNSSVSEDQVQGVFVWDKKTQGIILGSFFWGYMVTQIPAAFLCQRFGSKRVMAGLMLSSTVATLLVPVAARSHVGFLVALRVITGMGSGVWFPGFHQLWAQWAPPLERSKLVGFSYAGAQLGNIVTLPISSLLCASSLGWASVFYVFGGLGVVWVVVWMLLIADRPSEHPRISDEEKEYLRRELSGQVQQTGEGKLGLPIRAVLSSGAVWAIIVANIAFDWGGYTFLTMLPTYLSEVLNFPLETNGFLASVPYIGFWSVQVAAAWVADSLRRRGLLSTAAVRKLMSTLGMLIPGLLVIVVGFFSCDERIVAVVLLTVGVSAKGCAFSGLLVNHVDIAPQYAGVLFSISNSLAAITGLASPSVVAAVTPNGTQAEWRVFFFITAGIYFFGTLIYLILARGELQAWAYVKEEPANGKAEKNDVILKDPLLQHQQQHVAEATEEKV